MLGRLVATAGQGLRVRKLGGNRAGEIRLSRFLRNAAIAPQAMIDEAALRTASRCADRHILAIQDTTVVRSGGGGGLYLHAMIAVDADDGAIVGAVDGQFLNRDQGKRGTQHARPIEEKESYRWLEGLRQARQAAEACPQTQCVCVADSEADIYELFSEERGPAHWLIRACQDRALARPGAADAASRLWEAVEQAPVLFTRKISVRGRKAKVACEKRGRRQPRESRETVVEVRAATVTLRPPPRADRRLPPVQVQVVLVREVNPPAGDVPVEWLLVTTLPIDTVEQVRQIVAYYCVRWMIEVYFRTLKSGCRVEARRFEQVERFTACLAVYQIVAWRTLYVCHLGRTCPDLDCEAVFDPAEWKAVWVAVHRKRPPRKPPRLAAMIRLIAQLGGYVNRPNRQDPPGPQTVWLGLQRMYDLAWAWEAFGPESKLV